MKKLLIPFCAVALIASITVFAYNSDKGPAKQKDGITELPQTVNDSLFNRGKKLAEQTNYSDQDLQALALYLKDR